MRIKATAHIRDQDVHRSLGRSECVPGDEFEVPDGVAIDYFKRGVAVPVKRLPPVEFAVTEDAPEHAITRRGRQRRLSQDESD